MTSQSHLETELPLPLELRGEWTFRDIKQLEKEWGPLHLTWVKARVMLLTLGVVVLLFAVSLYQDGGWSRILEWFGTAALTLVCIVSVCLISFGFVLPAVFKFFFEDRSRETEEALSASTGYKERFYIDQRGIVVIRDGVLVVRPWWMIDRLSDRRYVVGLWIDDEKVEQYGHTLLKRYFATEEQSETFVRWVKHQIDQSQPSALDEQVWQNWVNDFSAIKSVTLSSEESIRISTPISYQERLFHEFPLKNYRGLLLIGFVGILLSATPWMFSLETNSAWEFVQILTLLYLFLLPAVIGMQVDTTWVSYRKEGCPDAWHVQFSPESWIEYDTCKLNQIEWKTVESLEQTAEKIIIHGKEGQDRSFRRSSFSSDEDYQQVITWIEAKLSDSKTLS